MAITRSHRVPTADPRPRQIELKTRILQLQLKPKILSESCCSSGESRKKRKGPPKFLGPVRPPPSTTPRAGPGLSDSNSFNHPGQLRKNRESSGAASMGRHIWTIREQLYLLEPFAKGYPVEEQKYNDLKSRYYKNVARDFNAVFEPLTNKIDWVPVTPRAVKFKFKDFGLRHHKYLENGYAEPAEKNTDHEILEYYIALYGGLFIDIESSSCNRSRSRATSSSVGLEKKNKEIRPISLNDPICAAGAYLINHGFDELNDDYLWYLRALEEPAVVTGFWAIPDDYTRRKAYLDNLLPELKRRAKRLRS